MVKISKSKLKKMSLTVRPFFLSVPHTDKKNQNIIFKKKEKINLSEKKKKFSYKKKSLFIHGKKNILNMDHQKKELNQ